MPCGYNLFRPLGQMLRKRKRSHTLTSQQVMCHGSNAVWEHAYIEVYSDICTHLLRYKHFLGNHLHMIESVQVQSS